MNLQKKLGFGLLALAIMVAVSAVPANAQQIYRATFTLPFEAQWGNTVMEPGQYTITVEDALGQKLIRVSGAANLSLLPGTSSYEPYADKGKLVFVSINGLYTLKGFDAGAIGQSFFFPIHRAKGERAQMPTVSVGIN